jgi:hypothetical protein
VKYSMDMMSCGTLERRTFATKPPTPVVGKDVVITVRPLTAPRPSFQAEDSLDVPGRFVIPKMRRSKQQRTETEYLYLVRLKIKDKNRITYKMTHVSHLLRLIEERNERALLSNFRGDADHSPG